jgi:hypothetical protein
MPERNVGGIDRLARALLAALLTVVAVRALRSGRRSAGLLALLGAVGAGFNATTCFCGLNATLGLDTTRE